MTKRRWTWEEDEDYPTTQLVETVGSGAGGTIVMEVYESPGGGSMPWLPDKRLITAAPALLEVAENMLRAHHNRGNMSAYLVELTEAVALAKGETDDG